MSDMQTFVFVVIPTLVTFVVYMIHASLAMDVVIDEALKAEAAEHFAEEVPTPHAFVPANQSTLSGFEDTPPGPTAGLSSGRRRTLRARRAIAGGIHPMTRRPLRTGDKTCGDCALLREVNGYFKCGKMPLTSGEATDIRKSWPACELYKVAL